MKKISSSLASEVILTVAILAALVLLIDPYQVVDMTSTLLVTILMVLSIALLSFGVFIWREQPRDERETLNGMKASRLSYFLGAGVLTAGVFYQSLTHSLDVWLAGGLGIMVLTKLSISAWSRNR